MHGLDGAVELLAQRAQRPLRPVEFRLIPPLDPGAVADRTPRPAHPHETGNPGNAGKTSPLSPESLFGGGSLSCAAVDGSSGVLVDNGSAWVVAYRAVVIPWRSTPVPEPAPEVAATAPADAEARIDALYAPHGLEGPPVRSAEGFAEALRALAELEAALAAVAMLPPQGLLLLDGALRGLPPGPAAIVARIEEACRQRGVSLAGVAKRSGIEGSGVPLVPALLAQADERGVEGPWSVEAEPGVHVAKLHRAARHAFRVDAEPDLLPIIASMSNDAAYVGYPYPLAAAHNRVALTGAHLRDLKARLDLGLRRHGAATAALGKDFHSVLDANVPG